MTYMRQTNRGMGACGDSYITPDGSYYGVDTSGCGTSTPAISSSDSGVDAGDWLNILNTGISKIAAPILNAQFGGPKPGQYFSINPKTGQQVSYALPTGSSSLNLTNPFGASSVSSFMPWILIGGGLILAIKLLGK